MKVDEDDDDDNVRGDDDAVVAGEWYQVHVFLSVLFCSPPLSCLFFSFLFGFG